MKLTKAQIEKGYWVCPACEEVCSGKTTYCKACLTPITETKPKLTKAQEKRFDKRFGKDLYNTKCGGGFADGNMDEDVKFHLANELTKQKEEILEELEKIKIGVIDEGRLLKSGACAGCGYWLDDECNCKGINSGIDQAIKKINEN